jgi:protein-tyrosine-phosphatase
MAKLLLFVCTGNTCRSPMAEGLAHQWLENNHIKGWETMSAGTCASEGCQTSHETISALRDHGVQFDGRSTPLSKELIDRATIVLCMTTTHCMDAASMATDPTKVELLNPFGSITDPIGCDQSVYDALAKEMLEIIPKRVSVIIARHKDNKE